MKDLGAVPPILLMVAAVLLGLYVAISIAGRLHPSLRFLWRDPDEIHSRWHLVRYTLTPAVVWIAVVSALVATWRPGDDLTGGWSTTDLVAGPGWLLLGLTLGTGGAVAAVFLDRSDARKLSSWIPLLLVLAGIAALALGVRTTLDAIRKYPPPEEHASHRADEGQPVGMRTVDLGDAKPHRPSPHLLRPKRPSLGIPFPEP